MKSHTGLAVHQDLALLFEPDVLAPSQFNAILKSSHMPDPERRLMVAVLEDAVSCLSKNPRRGPPACASPRTAIPTFSKRLCRLG